MLLNTEKNNKKKNHQKLLNIKINRKIARCSELLILNTEFAILNEAVQTQCLGSTIY